MMCCGQYFLFCPINQVSLSPILSIAMHNFQSCHVLREEVMDGIFCSHLVSDMQMFITLLLLLCTSNSMLHKLDDILLYYLVFFTWGGNLFESIGIDGSFCTIALFEKLCSAIQIGVFGTQAPTVETPIRPDWHHRSN